MLHGQAPRLGRRDAVVGGTGYSGAIALLDDQTHNQDGYESGDAHRDEVPALGSLSLFFLASLFRETTSLLLFKLLTHTR
jgi:hypothetical protein